MYAGCPLSARGHGHVTKISILHPVLISCTVNGRPFKFYTELRREKYNNIYIQKFGNSRVVEFCVVLASVTNSRDIYYDEIGRSACVTINIRVIVPANHFRNNVQFK